MDSRDLKAIERLSKLIVVINFDTSREEFLESIKDRELVVPYHVGYADVNVSKELIIDAAIHRGQVPSYREQWFQMRGGALLDSVRDMRVTDAQRDILRDWVNTIRMCHNMAFIESSNAWVFGEWLPNVMSISLIRSFMGYPT